MITALFVVGIPALVMVEVRSDCPSTTSILHHAQGICLGSVFILNATAEGARGYALRTWPQFKLLSIEPSTAIKVPG